MKKITILVALMLLVSVSTVLAVRTHQRNLTQLTAQNIEALTGGEDGPYGDKTWFEEQWDRIVHDEYSNYQGESYNCPEKWYAKVGAAIIARIKGAPAEGDVDVEIGSDKTKKGTQCLLYCYGSRCLRVDC